MLVVHRCSQQVAAGSLHSFIVTVFLLLRETDLNWLCGPQPPLRFWNQGFQEPPCRGAELCRARWSCCYPFFHGPYPYEALMQKCF